VEPTPVKRLQRLRRMTRTSLSNRELQTILKLSRPQRAIYNLHVDTSNVLWAFGILKPLCLSTERN
jgi:repressor of nif and glnA expression